MLNVLHRFALAGAVVSCERYGSGHINQTYLARTAACFGTCPR